MYTWGRSFEEGRRRFDETMDTSIQRRVADARKAGIHPLFALGHSPASPGVIPGAMPFASSNVDDPDTLPRRVQGASSAVSRMARDMFDLDYRSKQLDLRAKEIEVQRMSAELAKRGSPGAPPVEEVPYTHIQARDPWTGELAWYPNPDIFETPETLGAAMYVKGKPRDPERGVKAARARRLQAEREFKIRGPGFKRPAYVEKYERERGW